MISRTLLALVTAVLTAAKLSGQTAHVQVRFSEPVGPMEMEQMCLGQGGLSDDPMWANRIPEIRALHPKLIRLFIQEYFNLLPEARRFHFETLDRSVETILSTGASPLMCICFKPRLLFPKIDQDIVDPSNYEAWENLVQALVKHYRDRKAGIRYWEIANEPDIGEDGGCPFRFKPQNYVQFYKHTTAAILRADPAAHVGGPALASAHSPILPVLLDFCETNRLPLHFVSWHIYSSDPQSIRRTIDDVHALLKNHSGLKPETILDEWNMDLMNPPADRRFQPAFICETIWQMKESHLDYCCYYHIRDWHVDPEQFRPFMSEHGAAFMARWWNRMPQFDGLFDYQDEVRPSYFAFKLLSRCVGERVGADSDHSSVHAFATRDGKLRLDNLLVWNFSTAPVVVELTCTGLPAGSRTRHIVLNASGADNDENLRLRPDPSLKLEEGGLRQQLTLDPYAIHYWSFE